METTSLAPPPVSALAAIGACLFGFALSRLRASLSAMGWTVMSPHRSGRD